MIRILFRKYRFQIFMAFALVIVENKTFIAEPYVFGVAIDDLREANRIENEVDSSVTNTIIQQAIDSVRDYLLDSLSQYLPEDSSQSFRSNPEENFLQQSVVIPAVYSIVENSRMDYIPSESPERNEALPIAYQATTILFRQQQSTQPRKKHHQRRDSLKQQLNKHIENIKAADTSAEARAELLLHPPPRQLLHGVRRAIHGRDSIRQIVHSGKTLTKKKILARDSLRQAIANKPHTRRQVIGRQKKPVSFFVPKELGPFLPPMIPWVLLFVISSIVGAIRRVYDTKVYTRMFADLSSEVVAQQLEQGEDLSKIAGRSSLAWQNIEFFQYSLPEFIEQLINVGGAILALAIFDWRVAIVGGGLVMLVALSSKLYMRNVMKYQVKLNDMHEQEYNMFAKKDPQVVKQYYTEISGLEVKYSNRTAASYGIIRFLLLLMFVATLYISLDLDRFTIGEIYSIVAYVWTFVTASEYIPYLSEKWVSLKDTTRRLQSTELIAAEE
jgi:ABC-type multidrug transport system fused ATPase/permease subunit